jgi:hypothetical protein
MVDVQPHYFGGLIDRAICDRSSSEQPGYFRGVQGYPA